jgi:DNA repair protein RadC
MSRVKELLSELYEARQGCTKLSSPEYVAAHMLSYQNRRIEYFVLFMLDNKNNVMARKTISRGSVDQAPVYVREIIRQALIKQASGIVIAHNHPGGDPNPSVQDQELTARIQKAAQMVDVRFLDHVIVARDGHFSFQAQGLL